MGLGVFAVVWCLRVATRGRVRSSAKQRLKLARVLVLATLAFLAIAMRLTWTIDNLDGKPQKQLTWWQQVLNRY